MNNLRRRTSIQTAPAALPFIITVETTSANETFTLPLAATGNYNFIADWGDLQSDQITTWNQSETTHTYTSPGIYDITMSGTIQNWFFAGAGDRLKIIDVKQWGNVQFVNARAFEGCENLDVTATDVPDFSLTTTLESFFSDCSLLTYNTSINNWNVGNVENFSSLFSGCALFNQPISNWSMGNATTLERTFINSGFDQNIGIWNVVNVSDFERTFANCPFNNGGSSTINNWNMISATTFLGMFEDNSDFNQPIGNWNTSLVTSFNRMFNRGTAFDQDISTWNIGSLLEAPFMFNGGGAGLSQANLDALLIAWSAQDPNIQNNVTIDFQASNYTLGGAAEAGLNNLINNFNWTILGVTGV